MLDNVECGSTEVSRGRAARLRIFAIILGAAVAVTVAGVSSRAAAKPAAPADAPGADVFKTNCVVCHGADGAGSPTGKALQAPDLHADVVQKMTVAEMVTQVSDGKNNMPPFKNSLTKDQIQAVVTYVRTTFGKKK
jgi:mono/diheme cytochrome c family protein